VKLEAWAVGITAGSREVPGRNAGDRIHTYRIIIIMIIIRPYSAYSSILPHVPSISKCSFSSVPGTLTYTQLKTKQTP